MKKILLTAALSTVMATSAHAELFNLELTQGTLHERRSYDSILDLFDDYQDGRLDRIMRGYDDTRASSGVVNFRGIPMTLNFDDQARLTFNVDSLGIHEVFNGGTQRESFRLLKEYLERNNNGILQRILRAGVEQTPFDAVAGNPNSLMSHMANSSFYRAGGSSLGYLSPSASRHSVSFQDDHVNATTILLPIGKTFQLGESEWALLWDMPISYTDMEGSVSYMAHMGLGLKIPVMEYWSIIPSLRVGIVGSADMLSGGILYSLGVTSAVAIPFGNWTVGMTNMMGIINSVDITVKDYEIAYDLQNQVFKNGVHARYDFNEKYAVEAAYDYTFFTGDSLYIDNYHNFELSATRKMDGFFSGISLVGNYTFASNYHAYHLGVRFLF